MAVAIGVDGLRHFCIGLRAVQKLRRKLHDRILFHTRELRRSGCDRLGPLGLPAHDKHWLSKRRRFLLKSAGVGHDHVAAGHQVMHLLHIHRVNQMDPLVPAQNRERALAHHRA